ncbi:ComE operon protein 2 [Virgibacillus sp. W0430]|uniref:ComE operon protein 2 n=1 Tax=Virgibacillus sp. W0430 TaxID=3391580 RepID=UPI003F47DB82
MERISWQQYFMAQSYIAALRSTCTRLKVGAVIVRDNRMIASGYNGSVSDGAHCIDHGCYMVDGHCARTVHAEANALLQCARFGVSTESTHIYVTHYPCLQCCKMIIQSGITKLFYAEDYRNHKYAIDLFKEAGIATQKITLEDISIETKSNEKRHFVHKLLSELEATGLNEDRILKLKQEEMRLF